MDSTTGFEPVSVGSNPAEGAMGCSSNGKTDASKTSNVGSIPTLPAEVRMTKDRPPKNKFEKIALIAHGYWWGICMMLAAFVSLILIYIVDPIIRYFRWHKSEKKPVYDWEDVKKEIFEIRRERRFQNLLLDIYYWLIRNLRWIWEPAIIKGYIIRAWQRCTRGWSDRDLWSLDYTIAKFALPRLKRLKETKHGIPTSMFDDPSSADEESYKIAEARWNEIMDKMIWSMDYIANNREYDYYPDPANDSDERDYYKLEAAEMRFQEGMDLFAKHFRSLWD